MKEPDLFFATGNHDRAAAEYLNKTFLQAAVRKAADVHILFESEQTLIQYRLSGDLEEVDSVPNAFSKLLDEKIRARANLSAADRHIPLDGRMRLIFDDRTVDVRVSIVPTIIGQKIVCRLMDESVSVTSLREIQMTKILRHCLQEILGEPNGLFLVCGPTGHGKSTTLYAAIDELNDGTRNIFTLEHPVERIIAKITQVPISQHITFASGLRAGLRQDPDVILVGEIRDAETANIAIQAANTGHLVLATVHANNSAMAITRLLDMGVDPQTLADALRGCLAQRLVDTIPHDPNREMRDPTEAEIEWMECAGIHHYGLRFPANVAKEEFTGRVPVMEMIRADSAVKEAMLAQNGEIAMFNAAIRQPQFETIAQAAVRLAASGQTTIEKVMKLDRVEAMAPEVKRLGQVLVALGYATPEETFTAAEHQVELRKQGKVRRIGQILVEEGICTIQEVIEAIGYTEGAPDLSRYFVTTGKISHDLAAQVELHWRTDRAGQSLFNLYIELNHLTKDDFNDPSLLQYHGRRIARAANTVYGPGSLAIANAVAASV
ncbi:ATPase, T2SS/T4P/T4SS family [Ralstonia pseudosolanacearum]|uniref:GspE/PulE family protein n=1 Tax=Ralstonia pseudosolanacearum TaxID=1310165 RepID=UPI003CF176C0